MIGEIAAAAKIPYPGTTWKNPAGARSTACAGRRRGRAEHHVTVRRPPRSPLAATDCAIRRAATTRTATASATTARRRGIRPLPTTASPAASEKTPNATRDAPGDGRVREMHLARRGLRPTTAAATATTADATMRCTPAARPVIDDRIGERGHPASEVRDADCGSPRRAGVERGIGRDREGNRQAGRHGSHADRPRRSTPRPRPGRPRRPAPATAARLSGCVACDTRGGHPPASSIRAEYPDKRGRGGKAWLGSNRRLHVDDEWRCHLRIHPLRPMPGPRSERAVTLGCRRPLR